MNKTFVIGDIHGCYDEFIELIEQMGVTKDDLLISLGDIVDRGNKSVELYEYFKNRENAIVLMGNHEQKHLKGVLSYSQEIVKVQFKETYSEFLNWLKTLPYFYEVEDAIIVHAFFEHDIHLQEQKEEVLAGTTSGSKYLENKYGKNGNWLDAYTGNKPIIYGHSVVGISPQIRNNTFGIDTGACHGGMLTAVELPGFKIHQIKVERDYWKEEQAKWQIPVLEAKDWENMKISQVYKQIEKLEYKKEADVKSFLKALKNWMDDIELLYITVKNCLEEFAKELEEKYQGNFNREVSNLEFNMFLFKAKANKLTLQDLKKTFDTPQKVMDLAKQLNLKDIPKRVK